MDQLISGVWGCWRRLTCLPSSSQQCSIGLRSGDIAGQGKTSTWCCANKFIEILAVWGLALSCWNVILCPFTNGTTMGIRMASQYCWAFRMPWTTTRSVQRLYVMPAQTMTEGPPYGRRCRMATGALHSPRLLHTRCRPSPWKHWKRLSSDQRMRLHMGLVQAQRALHHSRRFRRCLSFKARATNGLRAFRPFPLKRFRTVWSEIRWLSRPWISAAVWVDGRNRSLKSLSSMRRSWRVVVALGLPDLGWSSEVLSVSDTRLWSLLEWSIHGH